MFYLPFYLIVAVFEGNAFVTKSRPNAFTHSLKKRMAAAASVAKAGSGATVRKRGKKLGLGNGYLILSYLLLSYDDVLY